MLERGITRHHVALTRGRVAMSALQQAARHERAALACLSELEGVDGALPDLVDATRRRLRRHLDRAASLTRTAMRLQADPAVDAFFAARLESQERLAMRAEYLLTMAGSTVAA